MTMDNLSYCDEQGRICRSCATYKEYSFFHKHKSCKNGYNTICKECRHITSKKLYKNTPYQKRIWNRARSRATEKLLDFNIDLSDIVIPIVCPVLGIKLDLTSKSTRYSPSIDRIDSSKGYVKGNIQVISNRANMLKNNATIDELKLVISHLADGCEVK